MRKPFKIVGAGVSLPDKVLTNADLEKMVNTSDEWIVERTGIRERRIVESDVATSDLAAGALAQACGDAGLSVRDLDTIIVATSTPDTVFPSTACWTQRKLGIKGAAAFDVSAGCTGWMYALELGVALLMAGTSRRVGVCGAEVMSRVIDWTDRSTCVLFGDGAGATIIEKGDGSTGILASNWGADGNLAPILYQPAGGTQKPATAETVAAREHAVYMEGNAVFRHAVRAMSRAASLALDDAGLGPDAVDLLIPHQANIRIMEATRQRCGVSSDRLFGIVDRYGNMSAASVPVALHHARRDGRLADGSALAVTAFGTGLTWAGSVIRM
ncbi:MAG: ketoacyl-ACP synthase III [Myxococcales bacterium FL481]|nr:MAG: ketoacyl-ACP synthase III [Myxococcales bacterium FL481]